MLCYRCGSHVPDGSEACTACGQKFAAGLRGTPTGTFSRRKLAQVEGAPYKVGDLVAERYEIKDVIGQGPIGVVYRALDREIDVEIALKVVSPRLMQTPDERRSFAREIRTAKKLSHNNIVKLYDDGQDGERVFFTQQYLDGLTLRRIIDLRKEKGQYFQLRELEPIVTQIAAALDHAAAATRPHGDLKPENVIVLPDLLKVTDFGLSTGLPRQPFVAAQRGRGDRYLAPEFLSGQEIDSRADIYSLGAMVGEMLAGVLPDPGGPPELASRNHDLPHSIEPIYRRAVNANPGARYPRAGELAADLAGLLEGMSSSRREPSRSPPPPPSAATRAPPGGRIPEPEPEVVELADDDVDEVEVPDPRSRAAEVAAGLEAEVVARKPRPPPPPPDEGQEPAPRSNGRASGIREAKPASGEARPVSGVRDGRPPSGVREGRSSGVRSPPPPPPAEPQTPGPPVARELSLERPPERGAKAPKPDPTPSAPLPLSKPKKPASRGGPSPALLAIAVVLGLGVAFGAFSGWRWWRTEQTAREEQLHRAGLEAHAEQARLDAEERARLAAAGDPATDAPPVIPDADRAEAEQGAAAKLAEEQAAAAKLAEEQAAAGKLAADKAAAELAAAQKAALERAAGGKAPPELRAAERAEQARLEEERKQAALAAAAAAAPSRAEDEARRAEEARKREEALEAARAKAEEEKKPEVKVAAVTPGGGCPGGMSLVQAGAFKRGVAAGDTMKNFGDLGQESVDVGAYCIDKWEYPNRPKGKPTVRVPFGAAESACKKGGKRICTEEEWEKACKGPGNARFPYGGTFDAKACNTQDETGTARELADSMSFPRCRSGYGAYDMAGNVAEWTSGSAPAGKVTKGGAADRPDFDSRCAARKGKPAGSREEFLGFRCCADPK